MRPAREPVPSSDGDPRTSRRSFCGCLALLLLLLASWSPKSASAQQPDWTLDSEYRVSDLSGDVGEHSKILDLKINGIQFLTIGQAGGGNYNSSYRPCNIGLGGKGPGDYGEETSHTSLNWNACLSVLADEDGQKRFLDAHYDGDYYIKSLRVCQNRRKNNRIKGFQTGAIRVTKTGEFADTDGHETTNPNCGEWHRLVRCRSNEIASGVRVHYQDVFEEFTGLELICRRVVPRESETARAGLEPSDSGAREAQDTSTGPTGLQVDASLDGSWEREDSNNPQNDGMRITVSGGSATLTAMPATGSRGFSVGQVLWQDLTGDGRLKVRGSNGRYYSATITMDGTDRLHIDIDDNPGPGYDQTWVRAGPSIDGEWVLVSSRDDALPDSYRGMRIRVEGGRATVQFLTAVAARSFRVGDEVWRSIQNVPLPEETYLPQGAYPVGKLQYTSAVGGGWLNDKFWLRDDGNQLQLGMREPQLWARPSVAEELMAAAERGEPLMELPQEPVDDPSVTAQGPETPDIEHEVGVPENLPPPVPEPEEEAACLSTSLSSGGTGWPWEWGVEKPILPDATRPHTLEAANMSQRRRFTTDIDRSYAPGSSDHFSILYAYGGIADTRGHREDRDLTASELDERIAASRGDGFRLTDLEGYSTPAGVRFSGVWVRNDEGIDWLPSFDLTSAEYGTIYTDRRKSGYRLVDFEAYSTADGPRYAGVWYRSCDNANWREWRDMDRDHFDSRRDSLAGLGFHVIDFESYRTPEGQRYGAIWEQVPGGSIRFRPENDLKWFLNYHRRYVDLGFRLVDFESYETVGGVRYAGVWVENDARYRYPARDSLDRLIRAYRKVNDLPAISVVIIEGGDVVYRRGFGWANVAEEKAAHSGTIYLAASVSKAIGGTLAARLEEQGRIDLTARTRDALGIPTDYVDLGINCQPLDGSWWCQRVPEEHKHTVEQLLAKTGCMWAYGGPEPPIKYYRWRAEALVEIWDHDPIPDCTPGLDYHYSTHGFTFVGAALEAATGTPIAELLEEEITQPLGLSTMRAMYTPSGLPHRYDRAAAYKLKFLTKDSTKTLLTLPDSTGSNPSVAITYSDNSWKVLGGGIETSALDLARFGWKTLHGDVVSDSVRNHRLWRSLTDTATVWKDTVSAPAVGLAWRVNNTPGKRKAWHLGSWKGARSMLEIRRDEGRVIAIMSNRRNHAQRGLVALKNDIVNAMDALAP